MDGCVLKHKTSPDEEIIAQVGEKRLLRHELAAAIPVGITKADSTYRAEDFIHRWVKQELLLKTAEENLSDEQKDVQSELDQYRTSLLIHRYEQALVSKDLDTTLTSEDIQQFYNTHPDKFILDKNIVKAIFISVPENVAKPDQLKRWMKNLNEQSRSELEKYSFQYALRFDYFNEQWIEFSRIRLMLPNKLVNPDAALSRNGIIEFTDNNIYYLTVIKDVKQIGDKAPFEFEKEKITNLILNTRKMEFIEALQKKIYQKGIKENQFKISDRQ